MRGDTNMHDAVPAADKLPAGVVDDSDLANAYRLQHSDGQDLRHSGELGWLVWDGCHWAPDTTGEVDRRVYRMARRLDLRAAEMFTAAAKANMEDEVQADAAKKLYARAKALSSWARKSQDIKRIKACSDVARRLEGIAIRAAQLDQHPDLLVTASHTVDLRKGVKRGHRREDLITRMCRVTFDPDAKAPLWEAFVARVLPDPEVRAFVQRSLGYSLTGSTGEQCMFVCYGGGANGKSTLLETVRHVLGDYAAHCQTDTLMSAGKHGRGTDNDLARLRGARFVTAIESGESRRLDEERIKTLTGGDTIAARFLYREFFEFRPDMKLWLACNHQPEVRGTDDAIWRRLRLIPFEVQIPPEERDGELPAKLRAEAPGILAWMAQGCAEWQRGGLQPPEAVMAATTSWRAEANDVARFVEECCVVLDVAKCKSSVLYAAYRQWAAEQGTELMTAKAFAMRLRDLGHQPDRTNAEGRIWRGIGLHAREEHDA